MKRALKITGAVLLFALLLLVAVLAFNTIRFSANAPQPLGGARPAPADPQAVARLAAAVRIPTVSHEGGRQDAAAFAAFDAFLQRSFPRVHAQLGRQVVAGHSLFYTWASTDPRLAPVLLAAHHDVVPVAPGTDRDWTHPPFAGVVAGGYVWGRGAWDDKSGVMGILEAAERLLAAGHRPRRTLHFAFGHDEEVGGQGAHAIAALLRSQGIRLHMVLDEGMVVTDGIIAGAPHPVALIGVAEKGYASVELVAQGPGGHSSMPNPDNPLVRLARAVERVAANTHAPRLSAPVVAMLDAVGPGMPLGQRIALANRWLTGPLLLSSLDRSPSTSATIRTTTAPTIIQAGTKDNVLPQLARAVINHRLLPGDSTDALLEHLRRTVDDPAVRIRLLPGAQEPSPVSPMSGPPWDMLSRSIAATHPDAIVAPGLTIGATDARHYAALSNATYRFLPVRASPDDLARFHGTNERISVADYGAAIAFYERLMREASGS